LQKAREINDQGMTATTLLNLGNLQSQLGQLDEAQKNVEIAIPLYEKAGMDSYLPSAMNMLGDLYLAKGNLIGARKTYKDSLNLATKQGSASAIAASRAEFAALGLEEDAYGEAETLARQSADEFASEKLVDSEADARTTLVRALLAQGKLPEARIEAEKALKLSSLDRAIALNLSITNARLKWKEGAKSEARRMLEQELAEASKWRLLGTVLRIKFYQAEMQVEADPKTALRLYAALEKEAMSVKYLLIAKQAQAEIRKLSKL
jgi:tetratricopeptide (TPR) repeat protein